MSTWLFSDNRSAVQYSTCTSLTHHLIKNMSLSLLAWKPAVGTGALAKFFPESVSTTTFICKIVLSLCRAGHGLEVWEWERPAKGERVLHGWYSCSPRCSLLVLDASQRCIFSRFVPVSSSKVPLLQSPLTIAKISTLQHPSHTQCPSSGWHHDLQRLTSQSRLPWLEPSLEDTV